MINTYSHDEDVEKRVKSEIDHIFSSYMHRLVTPGIEEELTQECLRLIEPLKHHGYIWVTDSDIYMKYDVLGLLPFLPYLFNIHVSGGISLSSYSRSYGVWVGKRFAGHATFYPHEESRVPWEINVGYRTEFVFQEPVEKIEFTLGRIPCQEEIGK